MDTQATPDCDSVAYRAAHGSMVVPLEDARRFERQRDGLMEALEKSMLAIDDWLNTYADDQCDPARVAEARERISECGTLAYIARVQQVNRAALAQVKS